MNGESPIWFPEPLLLDDTYQDRAEHALDWLARSTVPRAKACRRFLNENIAKLPASNQSNFVHDLREKWHSTFFELIVARILQELGASIVIEDRNPDGRRPDFRAQFPDAAITVEAKAPIFDAATGAELKNRVPLLNFIESNVPIGWRVCVDQLPNIGPADSRKNFERTVQRMLNIPPPNEEDTDRELTAELPAGIIHLHLFPNLSNERLGWEAPISLIDNSQERIRLAVKRKRRQVRTSQTPVVLAIQASGICSDFEDFDLALFGSDYDRYDEHRRFVETGFMPNGVFNDKNSDKAPTFAGVLAFLNVGW